MLPNFVLNLMDLSMERILKSFVGAAGIFYVVNSFAATATTTLAVSAVVTAACAVGTVPLAFGTYDPTSGSVLNGSTTLTVTCTLDTSYNIGLDAGAGSGATVATRKMTRTVGGSDTLNYSLYQNSGRTTVWGNTIGTNTVASSGTGAVQNYTVYGQIPASQVVPIAAYADTVNVTVTY